MIKPIVILAFVSAAFVVVAHAKDVEPTIEMCQQTFGDCTQSSDGHDGPGKGMPYGDCNRYYCGYQHRAFTRGQCDWKIVDCGEGMVYSEYIHPLWNECIYRDRALECL